MHHLYEKNKAYVLNLVEKEISPGSLFENR